LFACSYIYVFGKPSAFFHHEQKFTKQALLEFSLAVTDFQKKQHKKRNFPQSSAISSIRAHIWKSARAEMSVLLKLQANHVCQISA